MVSAYYWGTKKFTNDFDYDVSLETLRKKFSGEAIRFDDNTIDKNSFPGHPMSGSYYYLIARNNDMSRIESFLWASVVSSIHEFLIELPEVASINDLITTPVAGSTIGEAMYEFGRYFRCAKNKKLLTHKIMSVIMDPVALVNDWIWHGINTGFFEQGRCYSSPLQGEFNIFSGISSMYRDNTSRFKTGFDVGFHGKLYPLPDYGQESNIARFFGNTVMTELGLEAIVTDTSIDSVRFFAKTVWAAYHRQNITRALAGDSVGYSVLAGLASAFEHTQYKTDEFEDWIGAVHVLGPSTELALL